MTMPVRSDALNILHIIPRFVGGGPERSLLAFAACERDAGAANRHTVAVLEAPASAHLFLAARRLGVSLIVAPQDDVLVERLKRPIWSRSISGTIRALPP